VLEKFADILDADGDAITVTVLPLSDFQYSGDCLTAIKAWKDRARNFLNRHALHVLIVLVDVTSVTSAAVNFVVHKCDEGIKDRNCLYVLMLHFPAETAFLGMHSSICTFLRHY
jgi:hypothetical protein